MQGARIMPWHKRISHVNFNAPERGITGEMTMADKTKDAPVVHPYERYADKVTDTVAAVDKAVESIARRHKDWLIDVAVAAASTVLSSVKHGNIATPKKLLDALTGMRKAALIEWFITFGPLDYDAEAETFTFNKDKRDAISARLKKDGSHLKYAREMLSKPFWEWKPEPKYKPFDLKQVIAKAIATATKRNGKHDERDNLDGLDGLKMWYDKTFGGDDSDPEPSDEDEQGETEVVVVGATKKEVTTSEAKMPRTAKAA